MEDVNKMTTRIQKSFQELVKTLEERYGSLQITSIESGEGSFGVTIRVVTQKSKESFIIKTQKCHRCYGKTNHSEMFMQEINAINKVVKDTSYEFLLPYICAYYPTQQNPMWFDERSSNTIQLLPKPKLDRVSLGLIAMKAMDTSLIIESNERNKMTHDTITRGGWLSFIWSGSMLGIIGELILSGCFHGDLKEDNIVGEMKIKNDPFTYNWKAIDFGGSGIASSSIDFQNALYTPHYTPLKTIGDSNINHNDYAWIHDILALAHVIRNYTSFMTSTTRHTVPYSSKNNVERFFMTVSSKREQLTTRVLRELPERHIGVEWCKKWIGLLLKTKTFWKDWNTKKWWSKMTKEWLKVCDMMLEQKPRVCNRVPIVYRLQKLVHLLK